MRIPTDLQVLERIWNRYYPEFSGYSKDAAGRKSKIYVPIDVASISEELGVDGDIVFGRLYSPLLALYEDLLGAEILRGRSGADIPGRRSGGKPRR